MAFLDCVSLLYLTAEMKPAVFVHTGMHSHIHTCTHTSVIMCHYVVFYVPNLIPRQYSNLAVETQFCYSNYEKGELNILE